jgi:exopolysaccharide biosynthesis polyprenyl glycosylphosphotransferase
MPMQQSTLTISRSSTSTIDAVNPLDKRLKIGAYVLADTLSAMLAWTLFFVFRKQWIESTELIFDLNFFLGLVAIPFFWVTLFYLFGAYYDVYRRYRIQELGQTMLISLIGSLVLFFVLILDDTVYSYTSYYYSLGALAVLHLIPALTLRLILTSATVKKIHNRKIGFNTLIVGGGANAMRIMEEVNELPQSPGFRFRGFISINGNDRDLATYLPWFGKVNDIRRIIQQEEIVEIIVALESSDHKQLEHIMNEIHGEDVKLKMIPDNFDIMAGTVRTTNIMGAPLIEINREVMPAWQHSVKRIMDVCLSVLAIVVLIPVYLTLAVMVKLSSPGPVMFSQERVGLHGKPFRIYKFRSMRTDAEHLGPQLSSDNDSRVTRIGRFMRKMRLDELPQFWNVIKGEMSLVGPRPERQFYIDQIVEQAPHYKHLHRVKPGITSWGQVKFGYAENVSEMIQRLRYDLLYIENMSLAVDIRIMLHTIRIILKGSGK